jgi:[ribosomal protein S18]-alanine N-acetyltransferase
MNIRPALPDDLPAILALERSSPTAAHWSDAEYRLVFDPGATPRTLLVAVAPAVAGYIVVRTAGPEWEVENVVVSADLRGRGIGLALVNAVIEKARTAGAESLALEVRASNAAARALYTRAGFLQVGTRPRYYLQPEEDAVLYCWRSSRPPAPVEFETRS